MKKLSRKQMQKFSCVGVILLVILVIFIGKSFAVSTPVASVTIPSTTLSYETKQEGSFQITKSAKWISKGKARITLDFTSTIKPRNEYTDVILVLDISGSMNDNKFGDVKRKTINLVNELIKRDSKISLITFNDSSTIVSDFTTDGNSLIDNINNLTSTGKTNYYQALVNVENVLKNYIPEQNRDCVVLFLADGLPNVDTPNEVGQYKYLKDTYPFLTINGVQYGMGSTLVKAIKDISDNQFVTNTNNLGKFLYRAATSPIGYEKLEITDFINTDSFNISDIKDITVDNGKVRLVDNKIIWDLANLKTGIDANVTIDVNLNSDLIGKGGLYDTNDELEVTYKIGDVDTTEVSNKTPILAESYRLIYDDNAPDGCSVSNMPSSTKVSVFDAVTLSDAKPICNGYKFKGWKISSGNVTKINESYFIMPEDDVTIKAEWSKLNISKTMLGEISTSQNLYRMVNDNAVLDNIQSDFVSSSSGIDFGASSSDTNGKGIYKMASTKNDKFPISYYRGDVSNNNVIFADFCWKIVRTTETGGVKLIYNGLPLENGSCNNTYEDSIVDYNSFNLSMDSPADVGYMYGERYLKKQKDLTSQSDTIVYGNDVSYSNGTYTLIDTTESTSWANDKLNLSKKYHYTCFTSGTTCTEVSYVIGFSDETIAYYLSLSNGDNIETAKEKMFTNTTDSEIKKVVDGWYKANMTQYTDYLEDAIFCNNRDFYDGPLKGKDTNAQTSDSHFRSYDSVRRSPSVSCSNSNDSFTVDSSNGNGKLKYPVGLLTADEVSLAGHTRRGDSVNSYLSIGVAAYTMSPYGVYTISTENFYLSHESISKAGYVEDEKAVRPVISLKYGVMSLAGDGSVDSPFVVEDNVEDYDCSSISNLYQKISCQAIIDNRKSKFVSSSQGIDFSMASSDTNGKGIYIMSNTINNEFPINYYRGKIDDNHVKFANFCWRIVRTTSTGGVKLVYDGIPDSNGYCSNTGNASQLENESAFNVNTDSPSDIGYMYGIRYTHNRNSMSWYYHVNKKRSYRNGLSGTNYYYGSSVTYNDGIYTIVNPEIHNWDSDRKNLEKWYTCFSDSTDGCATVNIVANTSSDAVDYLKLENGEDYDSLIESAKSIKWIYGNDVSWDGEKYTLVDTIESSPIEWESDRNSVIADAHRYTCFSASSSCDVVNYVYYSSSTVARYIILENGKNVDDALNEMFLGSNDSLNNNDSTIKVNIDDWYLKNMLSYTNRLEDTIWCNDRSLYRKNSWDKDYVGSNYGLYFEAHRRNRSRTTPDTSCPNINDSFTVNSANGNGKLSYPVGLLTADELTLAGNGTKGYSDDTYLFTGVKWWTLSPYKFSSDSASMFYMETFGGMENVVTNQLLGVRPAISLLNSTVISSGDGTSENPFVVE